MKNRWGKGSMTVEATFVTGFALLLFTSVIYFAFFLHDRAVLRMTAEYYAETMLHMAEEPVDLIGRLESWRLEDQNIFRTNGYASDQDTDPVALAFRMTADQRMLMTRVEQVSATFNGRNVRLSCSARCQVISGSFVTRITGIDPTWNEEVQMKLKMDPEEFIRLCRGVIWRKKQ